MIPAFSSSFACTFVNDLPVANWSGGSSQVKLYGDVNGYFEQAVPYSPASIKCKYRCSFIIGTVSYAKSGELTMPTDTFLVIQ
jgi:hypothetical protein